MRSLTHRALVLSSLLMLAALHSPIAVSERHGATELVLVNMPTQQKGGDRLTRDEVYTLCKEIAPQYGFEPLLILALIEQESSYFEDAVRLEQGFYSKYIRQMSYTAVTESLLSCSFGLGQVMGESLRQMDYFFAMDSISVAMKLDEYIASPDQQVQTTCRWLKIKKELGSSHHLNDALRRYNGSPAYPPLVYARYNKLKEIYT